MNSVQALVERELGRGSPAGEDNVLFRCPFHKGGQERRPSFCLNVQTGQWICYTCRAGGGLKSLLWELGYPRHKIDEKTDPVKHLLSLRKKSASGRPREVDPFWGPYVLPEALLGIYDYTPNALPKAGFDRDLIEELNVGYDRERRRIVWPLRDVYGNLIGLSGRTKDGSYDQGKAGKYKLYKKELEEHYPDYERPGHNFLWNLHRVYEGLRSSDEPLILVEGFKACVWVIQAGFPYVAALTGDRVSKLQLSLLSRLACDLILFLDGDPPGLYGAATSGRKLIDSGLSVRCVVYPPGTSQPDDIELNKVPQVIEGSHSFRGWKNQLPKETQTLIRERSARWHV